jgi:hypothetical protein
MATWRYAARIPTAVSMSFHATRTILPADATLTVRSNATTVVYRARDLGSRDFWSRIQPGESLEFTLAVKSSQRSRVLFHIVSLQAGYRGLGGTVADHPYYRKLQAAAGSSSNADCVQNYSCNITPADTPPGRATVGVVVGNMYQCTGTLLNDVPGDNVPYVLTARHCETGILGGGDPGAASSVTIYWDATTPCGQVLGTLYDPGVATQTGATTVIEQQDAWLIQLDINPVVTDAQFAGFDATGVSVQGGYTIDHALGFDKQLTNWFGAALNLQQSNVLGVAYLSDFWEVVNSQGNIGPGASGSALIDQNNRLVGSLTLGRSAGDDSGYETCPVANPSVPNGSNGTADFTALAAVWNSHADSTGSATATLASILDPANTNTLIVSSLPVSNVTFTASTYNAQVGDSVNLNWNAPGGTQCSANGGTPGDGWSGTLAAAGTQPITESGAVATTYGLLCTLTGGRTVRASLMITWLSPQAQVYLSASKSYLWATRPTVLTWTSNVTPCSLIGGSLSLTNLASSGSIATTQSTAGDASYQLSCGSESNTDFLTQIVHYVTPSLLFESQTPDLILGQPLELVWLTYADSCTPSGGAPNDGWANINFGSGVDPLLLLKVTTLGAYTYTLTCSSGPISVTQSVAVTIENNAPYVTLSANPVSTTYTASPADYVTVSWISNLTQCNVSSTPSPIGDFVGSFPIPSITAPWDSATIAPEAPGTYAMTVTCTGGVGSAQSATSDPITVTVLPPPAPTATLSLSPSSVTQGQQFTITWASTNTQSCGATQNGYASGAVWLPNGVSGSQLLSTDEPGQFTFAISCLSVDPAFGSASAQATLLVTSPTGNSSGGSSSSGGNSGSSSSGAIGSASSGTHGGGGPFDPMDLGVLATILLLRRGRKRAIGSRNNPEQHSR